MGVLSVAGTVKGYRDVKRRVEHILYHEIV